MAEVKHVFIAGAPGSMWSTVRRRLRLLYDDYTDWSDVTPERSWRGHVGVYWNPGNEPGYDWILNFGDYSREEILDKLNTGYNTPAEDDPRDVILRFHMSHYFSFHLDKIEEMFPDAAIIIWQQPNHHCYLWWQYCGGHDTVHDSYDYYQRDYDLIWEEIVRQNAAIDEYIDRKGYSRDHCTLDWIKERFGEFSERGERWIRNRVECVEPPKYGVRHVRVDDGDDSIVNYREEGWGERHGWNLHKHQRITMVPNMFSFNGINSDIE